MYNKIMFACTQVTSMVSIYFLFVMQCLLLLGAASSFSYQFCICSSVILTRQLLPSVFQFIVLFVSSYRSLSLLCKYLLPSMHTFLLLPPLSLHGLASVKLGAQACSSIDAEFNRFSMILNRFVKRHYQNNIQCVTHLCRILFCSMNTYSKYLAETS